MSRIEVGKIVNTFGIKGEIKVYPYVTYLEDLKSFYIDETKMEIQKIRFQKNVAIIKIKGIDDINLIEKYKGKIIEINEDEKPESPDGYYDEDLIGMEVYTDEGKFLGKLDNVISTGANDVYEVGKILLPAIDEVIQQIDTKNNRMTVHIIKGLI